MAFITFIFISCSLKASPPSDQQVLNFVGKVRDSDSILLENYIISPHLNESGKALIHDKMSTEIHARFRKDLVVEVVDKKALTDICAFILAISDRHDPLYVDVCCLMFCKVEGEWKATPLMGQFDYSGYKLYEAEAEARQESLEKWGREAIQLCRSKLAAEYRDALSKKVEEYRKARVLQDDDPNGTILHFLDMCKRRDLFGVLATLGVDVRKPQSDDLHLIYSVLEGLKSGASSGAWKRLINESYIVVPLDSIEGKDVVSLAMYFPESKPRAQIMEFSVSRRSGRWEIALSEDFVLNEDGVLHDGTFLAWKIERENRDRLKDVPKLVAGKLEHEKEEDLDKLIQKVKGTLDKGDFSRWLSLYHIAEKEDEAIAGRLAQAASEWESLVSADRNAIEVLTTSSDENLSLLRVLSYSKEKPNSYIIAPIWIYKDPVNAWRLICEDELDGIKDEAVVAQKKRLSQESTDEAHSKAHQILIQECIIYEANKLHSFQGDAKELVEEAYRNYDHLLQEEEYMGVLKAASAIKGNELKLLDAIAADMKGRHDEHSKYALQAVHQSEFLGGASVKLTNSRSQGAEYLLYVCVLIDGKCYVAPNLLYRYEQGRGDKLLNKSLVSLIEKLDSQELTKSFNDLIDEHNRYVKSMLEQKKLDE